GVIERQMGEAHGVSDEVGIQGKVRVGSKEALVVREQPGIEEFENSGQVNFRVLYAGMISGNRDRAQGKQQESGKCLKAERRVAQEFRLGGRKAVAGAAGIVLVAAGFQLPARGIENAKAAQADFLQTELQRGGHHSQPVLHTAAEVDGGGCRKILGGAGDFADVEAEIYALGQHLVVENKVIGVFQQRQFRQNTAAESPVAGVVLGKLGLQEPVLHQSEKAVGNVLVTRHSAAQGASAQNARAQHHIVNAISHHAGHGRHQQGRVLIVGVNHDDDVGAGAEGLAVAGLLVAAITVVAVVSEGVQSQPLRHL